MYRLPLGVAPCLLLRAFRSSAKFLSRSHPARRVPGFCSIPFVEIVAAAFCKMLYEHRTAHAKVLTSYSVEPNRRFSRVDSPLEPVTFQPRNRLPPPRMTLLPFGLRLIIVTCLAGLLTGFVASAADPVPERAALAAAVIAG